MTVPRCHVCHMAMARKRDNRPLDVCACTALEGEPVFFEITQARELRAPACNLVKRE